MSPGERSTLRALWANAPGNLRGAFWMLASGATFTAMNVFLRLLADRGYPENQMVFARCAAGLLVLAPVMLQRGPGIWRAARPWVLTRRCVYTALGLFANFYAVAHLDLANVQALSFTRVLFVTLLAAWLLHELIGWRRWGAVAVEFIGVLVMLRPGAESFSLAAFAAIASSAFTAMSIITIKDLSRDHSVLTQILWINAVTTLMGVPFAFGAWETPAPTDWLWFAGLGLTGIAAQTCYVRGLNVGEASFLGLIDYARLPMMLVAGLIVFGQIPDGWAMAGAAIVIAATLYITLRETQLAKVTPVPVEP